MSKWTGHGYRLHPQVYKRYILISLLLPETCGNDDCFTLICLNRSTRPYNRLHRIDSIDSCQKHAGMMALDDMDSCQNYAGMTALVCMASCQKHAGMTALDDMDSCQKHAGMTALDDMASRQKHAGMMALDDWIPARSPRE